MLSQAFDAFTRSTERLQRAYEDLQGRVAMINEELEQTNKYLESILDSMTSGVAAVNSVGLITTFNRAAEEITGLWAAEVAGKHYGSVFGGEFVELTDLVVNGRRSQATGEGDFRRHDGRVVPIEFNCSVVTDKHGRIMGAVQVFRDLSEVKRLEEQARRSDRLAALGEMAAGVAHEIRNPLGGIGGLAALLAQDIPEGDPRKGLALRIVEGVQSLNRVVESLLSFTRPINLKRRRMRLRDVVESAAALLSGRIARAGVRVSLGDGRSDPVIEADPDLLKQVFVNLMANAVDAMPDGGRLSISWRERGDADMLEVMVEDTGTGISPEDIGKAFNPFFTTKDDGVGMGLAMVHRIVEAHGGRISVSSRVGRGTTFLISLPCGRR